MGGYRPRGGYDGEGSGGMRGGYGGAGGGMPYRGGNSGEYGMQAYTPPKHKLIRHLWGNGKGSFRTKAL